MYACAGPRRVHRVYTRRVYGVDTRRVYGVDTRFSGTRVSRRVSPCVLGSKNAVLGCGVQVDFPCVVFFVRVIVAGVDSFGIADANKHSTIESAPS